MFYCDFYINSVLVTAFKKFVDIINFRPLFEFYNGMHIQKAAAIVLSPNLELLNYFKHKQYIIHHMIRMNLHDKFNTIIRRYLAENGNASVFGCVTES